MGDKAKNPRAARRASKLHELTGKPSFDPKIGEYVNNPEFQALFNSMYQAAQSDSRVDPEILYQDVLEDALEKWDAINPLLNSIMGPVIKGKLTKALGVYGPEAGKAINSSLENQIGEQRAIKRNPTSGIPPAELDNTIKYLQGVQTRLPNAPSRIPELVKSISKPRDLDNMPDLTNFLLPGKR